MNGDNPNRMSDHHLVPRVLGGKKKDGILRIRQKAQIWWHSRRVFGNMTIDEAIGYTEYLRDVYGDAPFRLISPDIGYDWICLFGVEADFAAVLVFLKDLKKRKKTICTSVPILRSWFTKYGQSNGDNGNGNGNGGLKWDGDRTTIRRWQAGY